MYTGAFLVSSKINEIEDELEPMYKNLLLSKGKSIPLYVVALTRLLKSSRGC